MTKEQYQQLQSIYDGIEKQLNLLDAFMDANRPQADDRQGFLDEIKSTNDAEKQANYDIAYVVEPPPTIPTDAELENAAEQLHPDQKLAEKIVQVLEMEQTGSNEPQHGEYSPDPLHELLTPTDERYFLLCKWLIQQEKTIQEAIDFLNTRNLRVDAKQHDHLKNIIWFRSELIKGKGGAFDLKSILSQNDTTEQEKPVWEALAKTLK